MAAAQISLLIVYIKYNYKGASKEMQCDEVLENNLKLKEQMQSLTTIIINNVMAECYLQ
jgi:hypothetical protein